MKRPADQAKLLLFALLRSTATALATRGEKTSRLVVLPQVAQNIQLRLANRSDVPGIQKCNLACLPENYNSHFYCSHLRQWPDLALVAEQIIDDPPSSSSPSSSPRSLAPNENNHNTNNKFLQPNNPHHPNYHRRTLRSFYNNPSPPKDNENKKVVAYVLGKIESRPEFVNNDPASGQEHMVSIGHVTSLAVQKDYRRLGLAKAMMTQLHSHLANQGVGSCGLHVRTSNIAACRLYEEDGYEIAQVIPSYYQDGEDAFFMRKMFVPEEQQQQETIIANSPSHAGGQQSSMLFGRKIWRTGPLELRLPRMHVPPDDLLDGDVTTTSTTTELEEEEESESSSSPELLTGTM